MRRASVVVPVPGSPTAGYGVGRRVGAFACGTDLGLTVLGRARISGDWADTAVGLDGSTADIAVLRTPDGGGRIEMFQYVHPEAIEVEPVHPNTVGMHRVASAVDDIDAALEIAARHGRHPLRGVAGYEDGYELTYLRGRSDIPDRPSASTSGCSPRWG